MSHKQVGALWRQTARVLRERLQPKPFVAPSSQTLYSMTQPESSDDWVLQTDQVLGGCSKASLVHSTREGGHLVFEGHLSTAVPNGSKVVRSGFCLMRSKLLQPSLMGATLHDLSEYNGLELQLRGDGRAYMLNIQTDGLQQDDIFQAFIYTRGGPSWQTVHVPLSDMLLTSRGFVQNEQVFMSQGNIRTFGLLLADRKEGPFQLHLRHIKAIRMAKELANMDVNEGQ